ncbi:MAG TPA: MATE family efflux transporter [Steroidobacteraceae bacterium]|nr:MATE family efflux transporter [Steroidobacteraceae bacterium]
MRALDLTQGPITRTLIAFTLPTLGSNVLQSLNASVNAVWVGRFLGEAPLTAATNANMVLFLLMAAVFGVVMATGIMVGQSVGARDISSAKRVVGSSAVFIVLLSLATAVVGTLTAEPILHLMRTPPDAMPYAVSYLRIVFIATLPMFFYIYVAMTLRGAGDARTPFIFMFVSVGLDIALNPLLIFGAGPLPALGIRGAGFAMLISQTTTLLAMLVLLYRRKHFLCIRRDELHYLHLDTGIVKVLVTRGLPMGLQMLIVSSSMLTVLGLINGYGTDTAAAFGAAMQVWTYVQMPVFAVGAAVTAMAAQNIGAGRWERVSQATWSGVGLNAAMTGVLVVIISLFNRQVLSIFLPAGSAALPIAQHANVIALWSFLLFGVTIVLISTVRATGAVLGPLLVIFGSLWLARIPFAYGLAPRWGEDAIWWSFPVGSVVGVVLGWLYFRYGDWRKVQLMRGVGATASTAPPSPGATESPR